MKHSSEFSRTQRVGEQIRRELADIIRREISDHNIAGRLRHHLSQRLTTRTTPRLQFVYDSLTEDGNRLLALINSVQT